MIGLTDINNGRLFFAAESQNQTVEFLQLAAFAFPTDILLLRFAPGPLTMKLIETTLAIFVVQPFNSTFGDIEKIRITLCGL